MIAVVFQSVFSLDFLCWMGGPEEKAVLFKLLEQEKARGKKSFPQQHSLCSYNKNIILLNINNITTQRIQPCCYVESGG